MTGRPSIFSPELAALICARLAEGESLRSVCRDDAMPACSTVFGWLAADKTFLDQYARAMECRTNAMAEEILEIADDGSNDTYEKDGAELTNHDVIARSKLRVDTRKWLMARMAPKKYGDKVTQEVQGPDGGPVQLQRIERVIVPALPAPKAEGGADD